MRPNYFKTIQGEIRRMTDDNLLGVAEEATLAAEVLGSEAGNFMKGMLRHVIEIVVSEGCARGNVKEVIRTIGAAREDVLS